MSTAGKNRSILSGLVDGPAPVTETPKPAPGDVKEKTLHLVDPARVRMWARHNRRYDLLSEQACSELLEGLRSQGEQEFPAIVRAVSDNPDFDYEVICGARRHWSVSFLRNVEHRQIKFLIEVRDLDDEAASRLSDVENRARDDISDYERAIDYRGAVDDYYGGIDAGIGFDAITVALLGRSKPVGVFIAGVLVAERLGAPQGTVNALAAAFVLCRVGYIGAYLADRANLRSTLWFLGLGGCVALFFQG